MCRMSESVSVQELVGKVFTEVRNDGNDRLVFVEHGVTTFEMFHDQDCCESVTIEDVDGDLADLTGAPILFAEESSSDKREGYEADRYSEAPEWTFYRIGTLKGTVVIRWFGESDY